MSGLFNAIRKLLILALLAGFVVVGGGIVVQTEMGRDLYDKATGFVAGLSGEEEFAGVDFSGLKEIGAKSVAALSREDAPAVAPAAPAAPATAEPQVAAAPGPIALTYDRAMLDALVAQARSGNRDAIVALVGGATVLFLCFNLVVNLLVRLVRGKPARRSEEVAYSY